MKIKMKVSKIQIIAGCVLLIGGIIWLCSDHATEEDRNLARNGVSGSVEYYRPPSMSKEDFRALVKEHVDLRNLPRVETEFFGITLDASGNPAANVRLRYEVDFGMNQNQPLVFSGIDGRFSFNAGMASLVVVSILGNEVYEELGGRGFYLVDFAKNAPKAVKRAFPIHKPSFDRPAVFIVKKRGPYSRVCVLRETYQLLAESDGVYTAQVSLEHRKDSVDRHNAQHVIECRIFSVGKAELNKQFPWRCEIRALNGMVFDRSSENINSKDGVVTPIFEAPSLSSGVYRKSLSWEMTDITEEFWSHSVNVNMYIGFNDGVYARIYANLHGVSKEIRLESFLAPDGGRRFLGREFGDDVPLK